MSDNGARTLKAECLLCGSKFAMTDQKDRVFRAYDEWDREHKHLSESKP